MWGEGYRDSRRGVPLSSKPAIQVTKTGGCSVLTAVFLFSKAQAWVFEVACFSSGVFLGKSVIHFQQITMMADTVSALLTVRCQLRGKDI